MTRRAKPHSLEGVQEPDFSPLVDVSQASRRRGAAQEWLFLWEIRNLGDEWIRILSARFPHSLFWSPEREFSLPLEPQESARLEIPVRCDAPPASVVENAFLILRLLRGEEAWWIFARLRVIIDGEGAPETMTELVTTKRVGFHSSMKAES